MYWLQRVEGGCEPELLHLADICGFGGTAVDIGANVGLYTYPLSKRFRRVYAFEINDDVTRWITQYNPGNIELIHCGLSSVAGTANFYVPVAHGLTLASWGSLYRENVPDAEKYFEKVVKVAPLDDFGIGDVDFIKIDVEGHEVEVLKGAADTIERSRPVVLIEIKEKNLATVDLWFRARNYRKRRLEDLIGVRGQEENYIYVPEERGSPRDALPIGSGSLRQQSNRSETGSSLSLRNVSARPGSLGTNLAGWECRRLVIVPRRAIRSSRENKFAR